MKTAEPEGGPMTEGPRFLADAVAWIAAASDGWGHMGGWGWGMAVLGWLFMGSLIVLIAWLVVTSVLQSDRSPGTASKAKDVLDARYARSEIDRDEYLRRRSDLVG